MSENIVRKLREIVSKLKLQPFLGWTNDETKEMREAVKELSSNQRAQLISFADTPVGSVLFDPGKFLESTILIDDLHTKASESRPLAFIDFSDGYNSRVEVIDILESVRRDARTIGHPVIVFAIDYWQNILVWGRFLKSDKSSAIDEAKKTVDFYLNLKYLESAKRNLSLIGAALNEAVRVRSIPNEIAFKKKAENLNLDSNDNYLKIAWERLHSKHVVQFQKRSERIKGIEEFLKSFPTNQIDIFEGNYTEEQQEYGIVGDRISIETVIEFLSTRGQSFVYDEDSEKSTRPKWTTFRNAFYEFYFDKSPQTVKEYLKTARANKVEYGSYEPSFFPKQAKTDSIMKVALSIPLAYYCEPIECHSDEVGSPEFAQIILRKRG